MSKHWNPRAPQRGRTAPARWKPQPKRRARRGFRLGEIRLTVLLGVFAGLIHVFYAPLDGIGGGSGAALTASGGTRVGDPWAVRITDGDTFRYRGERIRIADIDTAEIKARCPEEARLASAATARMAALLRAGPFEMHPIGGRDRDQYGRKLRIVTRNGRSLGDQLVAEGLARTWEGRRRSWC